MNPTITDSDTGRVLWRTVDCADHCGVDTATWRSYVRKGMPPAAVGELGPRMPLWDAQDVRDWHAGRRSQQSG